MNDRELLERAAKTAGKAFIRHWQEGDHVEWRGGVLVDGDDWAPSEGWNPLTDDGDALRLAVKLGIDIDFFASGTCVQAWSTDCHTEQMGNDPYAATRRAIVRAAAAMYSEPNAEAAVKDASQAKGTA